MSATARGSASRSTRTRYAGSRSVTRPSWRWWAASRRVRFVDANDLAINGGNTAYADAGFSRYLRRAFLAGAGYDATDLGRPIIGITDLTSDFNPCHARMPDIISAVKRGV